MTMKKKIGGLLTNKEIYAIAKKPTVTEKIRLHYNGLGTYRE
jgi:hypothetical protein